MPVILGTGSGSGKLTLNKSRELDHARPDGNRVPVVCDKVKG